MKTNLKLIVNNNFSLIVDKPNCWYVHLLAGNPKCIFDKVKPLEYVCEDLSPDMLEEVK